MKLHQLKKIKDKKAKRIGRGYGSGKGGHTVGKGQKGQASRSGFQPLRSWIRSSKILSIPKLRGLGKRSAHRGYFKSKVKKKVLNVSDLNELNDGTVVDHKFLTKQGIVNVKSKPTEVKILGDGELEKKITVAGLEVSKTARKKIEDAGGKVI